MKIQERTIHNVAELLGAIQSAFNHLSLAAHWFRGHSKAEWNLIPSVHRNYCSEDEVQMTSRFRLAAPTRYPNCPASGDFARWICLMQHFGLPTRLLDWTESPLAAAYFAIIHEPCDGDATIWCLSPSDLNKVATDRASIAFLAHERVSLLLKPAFLGGDSPDQSIAVMGQDVDVRMAVQQGGFTIHGCDSPLEKHSEAHRFLQKFVIPQAARETFRKELWILGIRRSMLFPDIENLARELTNSWEWKHKGKTTKPTGGF
jgi:hypothetical protein